MPDAEPVWEVFERVVSTACGLPVTLAGPPTRLSGGFWAQIWGVELTEAPPPFDRPMVLRIRPDRTAGLREAVVQRVVAEVGFPTPRVLTAGTVNGLREAYIVMERINGRTPLGGLRLGPELVGLPKLLRHLPTMLATTANSLHQVNPELLRSALIEAGIESLQSNNPFRPSVERAAIECPPAGFAKLIQWLDDHTPVHGAGVICHGDLHPLNVLVDDRGATWLLDWTTATIGPREMDIGLTAGLLRCAPIDVPKPLRPIVQRITNRLAESFIDKAGRTAALDRAAVDWWEALQHGRCLAELVHGRLYADGVVGPGHPFETSVDAMCRRLGELTGVEISPPLRVPA